MQALTQKAFPEASAQRRLSFQRRMRSTLSGHCTPPRLTKPLTSPRDREGFLRVSEKKESAHFSFSLCTQNALSPSTEVPEPSPDLIPKLVFVQTLLRVHRTPKIAGRRTLALFTDAHG